MGDITTRNVEIAGGLTGHVACPDDPCGLAIVVTGGPEGHRGTLERELRTELLEAGVATVVCDLFIRKDGTEAGQPRGIEQLCSRIEQWLAWAGSREFLSGFDPVLCGVGAVAQATVEYAASAEAALSGVALVNGHLSADRGGATRLHAPLFVYVDTERGELVERNLDIYRTAGTDRSNKWFLSANWGCGRDVLTLWLRRQEASGVSAGAAVTPETEVTGLDESR